MLGLIKDQVGLLNKLSHNTLIFLPLVRSSCIDLPIELINPRKGLINIKNNDQKCFLWCHVRHINPVEQHPGRIKKTSKRIASNLNYEGIEFPVQEKFFKKIEVRNNICNNVFGYENELIYPIFISKQTFENSIDLLLLIKNDSHIMSTLKILTYSCFIKQKIKIKSGFVKVVCSVLVVQMC